MKVFSAVQPSGVPTIGNYIGAMRNFVELQEHNECIFCIADLHSLTSSQNPKELQENIRSLSALYLAIGIDPEKSILFIQSEVSAHTQVAHIVLCNTNISDLERMTQYKSKKETLTNAGLLCYPALMVADIILYNTELVPVGADQKQHLELTRKFVDKFNKRYNTNLIKPEPLINKNGARIMSLSDPTKKMSKSDNPDSYISLLDNPDKIRLKIKRAVTDSEGKIYYDKVNKPGLSNLLTVYSELSGKSIDDLVEQYKDSNYGTFKSDLSDLIISVLEPIQTKYYDLLNSNYLDDVLNDGAKKASIIANRKLKTIEQSIGLGKD